jgi:oligoendopeptidase F
VTLDGRELTGPELDRRLRDPDRAIREAAWRTSNAAWLRHRERLDDLFLALLMERRRLARAAGLPDYRAYRWRELDRLDYTPADALALHEAIAGEIVPLAARRQEARRARLRLPALRPWDLDVDQDARPPLQPFPDLAAFEAAMAGVFARLDPELGALYERMRDGYLDLGWRRGKSGGGEEWAFPVTGLPYALVNADGTADGVNLLLHEMGHAFHDYLVLRRGGLIWESHYPDEMAEFAAIALSHLAAPHLARDRGGFYPPEDAARVRAAALEEIVVKWLPHIAMLDDFQHWLYADAPAAVGPADLDAAWREQASRFSPWVDWSGLETEQGAGWQRAGLLFTQPFYSLEYALAHLGALQVWRNAQADPDAAWRAYRSALALGNTRPLPDLYQAAGARLPFDHAVVRDVAQTLAAHLDAGRTQP